MDNPLSIKFDLLVTKLFSGVRFREFVRVMRTCTIAHPINFGCMVFVHAAGLYFLQYHMTSGSFY